MESLKKTTGGSDVVVESGSVGCVYQKLKQQQALKENLDKTNKLSKNNVPVEIVDPAEVGHVNQEQEYLFSLSR